MIERTSEGVRVDVSGLVGAFERRVRRWQRAFIWTAVGAALLLSAAGFWWERENDQEKRRVLTVLKFDLATQRATASCWRAIALHPPGYGPSVPLDRREAAVAKCVEGEMERWVAIKNGGKR